MSAASLLGFGVVLVVVSWLASALLVLALAPLGRRGPAAARRAAFLLAALPVALGAAVTATLAIASLIGADHCRGHGAHAHLCLRHGAGWAERSWALGLLAAGAAAALVRGGALALALLRGRWRLRRLARSWPGDPADRGELLMVPSARPFCFVAGLRRPRIYVSTAARALLADDEWRAMLAHERGHVAAGDLRARLALELVLLWAAPFAAARLRRGWDTATERLRDSDAAERESPEAVASALVRMAKAALRVPSPPPALAIAPFAPPAPGGLAARVTALLEGAPRGEQAARRIARGLTLAVASVAALAAVLAEPLHHAFETLFG